MVSTTSSPSSSPLRLKRKRPTTAALSSRSNSSGNNNIRAPATTSLIGPSIPRIVSSSSQDSIMKMTTAKAAKERQLRQRLTMQHPQRTLERIAQKLGLSTHSYSYDALCNFFENHTLTQDGYCHETMQAIRKADLNTLKRLCGCGGDGGDEEPSNKAGKSKTSVLNCSNQFGESLLHLACRKAQVSVVDFLLNHKHHEKEQEGGGGGRVSVKVVDDMGRSPLHDAFWTCEPNPALVGLILEKCPQLLWIRDKRGHTPLSYARKHHWAQWNAYLCRRVDIIKGSRLLSEE